jgi:hypothetical protein
MIVYEASRYSLNQLRDSVIKMNGANYSEPAKVILKASVGQHVRHIIEMYQGMLDGYEKGIINYDNRKRNTEIEQSRTKAVEHIDSILTELEKKEKSLSLESSFGSNFTSEIPTTYEREVHFNLEHTIHHMAIIRIKLENGANIDMDKDYGIAFSTMQYKESLESQSTSS